MTQKIERTTDDRTLVSFDWAMKNILPNNIQAAKEKLMFLHMSEEERSAYKQFQLSRASALDVLSGQYNEGMKNGIEIGKEQGIEIGKEQGIEEGKAQTLRQVIPLMAQMRFGNALPADLSVRLQGASLATLQQLQETLANSATLEAWLAQERK